MKSEFLKWIWQGADVFLPGCKAGRASMTTLRSMMDLSTLPLFLGDSVLVPFPHTCPLQTWWVFASTAIPDTPSEGFRLTTPPFQQVTTPVSSCTVFLNRQAYLSVAFVCKINICVKLKAFVEIERCAQNRVGWGGNCLTSKLKKKTASNHYKIPKVTNILCFPLLPAIQCLPDYMHVVVSRRYLQSQGYPAEGVTLSDSRCRPTVTSQEVVFNIPYNGCGTTQEVHALF